MKLWVDDVRPAPDGWRWAKTYKEAIEMLHSTPKERLTDVSLDHDLGFAEIDTSSWPDGVLYAPNGIDYDITVPTGYDVLEYMIENDLWPTRSISVHSANVVGSQRMCRKIEDYGPYRGRNFYEVRAGNHLTRQVRYSV